MLFTLLLNPIPTVTEGLHIKNDRTTNAAVRPADNSGTVRGALGRRTMTERYELVVVGAGPGGSATAYSASKAGLNTVLLDRCCSARPHAGADPQPPSDSSSGLVTLCGRGFLQDRVCEHPRTPLGSTLQDAEEAFIALVTDHNRIKSLHLRETPDASLGAAQAQC